MQSLRDQADRIAALRYVRSVRVIANLYWGPKGNAHLKQSGIPLNDERGKVHCVSTRTDSQKVKNWHLRKHGVVHPSVVMSLGIRALKRIGDHILAGLDLPVNVSLVVIP